jgi:hypothetical protein
MGELYDREFLLISVAVLNSRVSNKAGKLKFLMEEVHPKCIFDPLVE